jgi:hypothetical protein
VTKLKLHLDVEKIELPWLVAKNELVFALPFLKIPQAHYFNTQVLNPHETTRFLSVYKEGANYIELTSVQDCDYVLLPFKWRTTALNPTDGRPSAEPYIQLAKEPFSELLSMNQQERQMNLLYLFLDVTDLMTIILKQNQKDLLLGFVVFLILKHTQFVSMRYIDCRMIQE